MAQQRDRKKERFWRRTIDRHGRGQESVRTFCDREGLSEASFYFWRRELQRRGEAAATSPLAPKAKPKPSGQSTSRRPRKATRISQKREVSPQLVPVSIIPHSAASVAPLEFMFPNGTALRIGSDAPWELVARVLGACGIDAQGAARSC